MVLLPEWECTTCTDAQKQSRGCLSEPAQPVVFGGERLPRCPRRPLLDNPRGFDEVFWLYQNYGRGILPYGQALYDNPHKLVRMFKLIDAAKSEANAEQDRKERKREAMKRQFQAAQGR
jgi:hypothetical protein